MAAVGLLESLMLCPWLIEKLLPFYLEFSPRTLNLIDEITKTKGNPTRMAEREKMNTMNTMNTVCGCFGGMGGCAMIGQSMINIGSGRGTRGMRSWGKDGSKAESKESKREQKKSGLDDRFFCFSISFTSPSGAFLLAIVLVAYPAIKQIPVMFNVCFHTFEWSSLKLIFLAAMPLQARRRFLSAKASSQQIRRTDALVIIVVTLVTLFTDLATAVAVGMVISLFVFALETSNTIQVVAREDSRDGVKVGNKAARLLSLFALIPATSGLRRTRSDLSLVTLGAAEAACITNPPSTFPRRRRYALEDRAASASASRSQSQSSGQGTLFFGSTSHFLELFDEEISWKRSSGVRENGVSTEGLARTKTQMTCLVFETGHVADFSAVQALNKLGERYGSVRKRLTLQQLMPKTHRVLSRAQGLLVEEITLSLDREEVLPAVLSGFSACCWQSGSMCRSAIESESEGCQQT
ncbi:ybaR [Symbiodinium natans]|uniref:YbaR protein n=1 Tax=Symbiodinium natans TaxID=878477 RepID=A0A812J973_9DINO|nr:ybaR [Symbiodinium natans]